MKIDSIVESFNILGYDCSSESGHDSHLLVFDRTDGSEVFIKYFLEICPSNYDFGLTVEFWESRTGKMGMNIVFDDSYVDFLLPILEDEVLRETV